ncbi:MAG: hypothetical protein HY000_36150 [Planctomycetes bacterium]|nr:hypothetical protein [Planctomycetota bacterium]
MKHGTMTAASSRTPAWPTKRRIAAKAAEIRSRWSETERRHRAEMVRKRLEQLVEVIGDAVE